MLSGYSGFEKCGTIERTHAEDMPWFKFHTPQTITNQFDEQVVVDYFAISTVCTENYDNPVIPYIWETMVFPCDENGEIPDGDFSGIYEELGDAKSNEIDILSNFISTIKE